MQWNMTSAVWRVFYLGLSVLKTAGPVLRPGQMCDLAGCVAIWLSDHRVLCARLDEPGNKRFSLNSYRS